MSAFRALVWKEWRDARATVAVGLAATVPLSLAFHALVPRALQGGWTAVFALGLMPALFALVLAGDLVAGDTRGGRSMTLRALPVAPIVGFGAKLAWLALASALFLGWCFALQLPALAWLGDEAAVGRYLRALERTTPLVCLGAALAAGALFASTLAVGGLKAMLLSALLVGLPLAGALRFAVVENLPVGPRHLGAYGLTFALVALLAAALAYCKGGLHHGARWRPALIGWSALALGTLPPAGFAAQRAARWLSLEPGGPQVEPSYVLASPDGQRVAVQVFAWNLSGGTLNSSRRTVMTAWVVDVETGALELLPGRNWQAWRWSEANELLLTREEQDGSPDFEDARRLDPDTMTLRGPLRDPAELYDPWQTFPDWAHVVRPDEDGEPVRVQWRGRDLETSVGPGLSYVQHVPGVVLDCTEAGELVRDELGVGRTTLVERGATSTYAFDALSLDDRFVIARVDGAATVLDAHTGARVAGPWPDRNATWLHGGPVSRFVLVGEILRGGTEGFACLLVDLETNAQVDVGRLKRANGGVHPALQRLPDGRLVVLRPSGAVELLAPDGAALRTLVAGR